MIVLQNLLDDAKCYETVRQRRWPEGVRCPPCASAQVSKQGRDWTQKARQKYGCKGCGRHFDDLSGTVFVGHHQPRRGWISGLYWMGLNLSNRPIAQALGLNTGEVQRRTEQ
jgi:transposase-like protein